MPEILLSSGSPYLDTVMFEPNSQQATSTVATLSHDALYVKPYHAATLVEPRLDNAKPSVWTNVNHDDSLLREILAAYFMHEYHLFPIFQKDYFLEDMAATEPDKPTQFCSALLVNAVLAYGSCCYKRFSNRFRYWEPDTLGYRFLAEAKRLWELDSAGSSNANRRLTSVQAAFIINIVLNLHGLDKIGDIYGRQGRGIAEDIGRASFRENSTLSIQEAAKFTRRLLDYFQALPKALTHKYIVLPAHYLLHLDYYVVLMTICQPFVRDEETEGINFQKIVHDSQRDINILLRLYYIRHGFSHADSWLTNPLAKLVFLSLQMISDNPSPQELGYLQSSLILALKGLREQGRNYYISRTVYYIARNQLRPQDAALLLGTEDPELAADQSPGLVGEVQSAWTPINLDISDNLAAKDLSQLAKEFLTIESNGPATDGLGLDSAVPA
ncbi:hypothetical protein E8E13_009462 [Curvularia kusanoi]|uniref:Xylanolytic transcriptional activator regulatory domain-containing protein n=1 Tax=Curvularia kusanoi TaxID=90978 RepID=A0A9P4WBR3_CURKU|nr:hypothetical protein E8E13_009462 [Curvularia kusanoi]